jgi:hypothetical protein
MGPKSRLERYSRLYESGLLSIKEGVGVVLVELAEVSDLESLWTSAPESLMREVLAHLLQVGPDNVPPAWVIGVNDLDWREAQTSRRKQIARELLRQ